MKTLTKMICVVSIACSVGCNDKGSDASNPTPSNPGNGGSTQLSLMKLTDNVSGHVYGKAARAKVVAQDEPVPTTVSLTGAYNIALGATIDGGGGTVQNGQVVGGVNSVVYITTQFANAAPMDSTRVCNFYRWTLQTDEVGNNMLYVTQGTQTGDESCQESLPLFTIHNPGQALSLQVQRDDTNTYFSYSLDDGATFTNAMTIPLSDFDSGDAVVKGDVWTNGAVDNCSMDGASLPCYPGQ